MLKVRLALLIGVLYIFLPNQARALVFTLAIDHAPPFSVVENTETPSGLSIDVVTELVQKLDGELEIIPCPWARCLALAESGRADLVAGGFKTKAREKIYDFIEPAYFSSKKSIGFYSLKSGAKIDSENDLASLRIGVQRGARYVEEFDQNSELKKISFNSVQTMIDMLLKGRIDTFIHVTETIEPFLRQSEGINNIVESNFVYQKSDNKSLGYVMLSKKSKHISLLPLLNKAMLELQQQGRLDEIMNAYLTSSQSN